MYRLSSLHPAYHNSRFDSLAEAFRVARLLCRVNVATDVVRDLNLTHMQVVWTRDNIHPKVGSRALPRIDSVSLAREAYDMDVDPEWRSLQSYEHMMTEGKSRYARMSPIKFKWHHYFGIARQLGPSCLDIDETRI